MVISCAGVNFEKALVFETRAFSFWVNEFLFSLIFAICLDIIFSQFGMISKGCAWLGAA